MYHSDPFTPPPDPPAADIRRTVTTPMKDRDFAMAINAQLGQLGHIIGTFTAKEWITFILDTEGRPVGTKPTMVVPNSTPGVANFALVESAGGLHVEGWMELWPKQPDDPPAVAPLSEREQEIWTRLAAALVDLNS